MKRILDDFTQTWSHLNSIGSARNSISRINLNQYPDMKKKPKILNMLEPEEIKNELKSLEIQWNIIKDARKDKKLIESQFREVKYFLKKSKMPGIGSVLIMYASSSLLLLNKSILSDTLDYDSVFLSVPASEKISVFMTHKDKFTDEDYWINLAEAYTLQNYKKIPYKVYYELFSAKKLNRERLMSDEELKILKKLPSEIKIYRGGSLTEEKSKRYGISWTLDKKTAENFAEVKKIRDKKDMKVFELTISKSLVIAYFNQREEDEIIYIHNHK